MTQLTRKDIEDTIIATETRLAHDRRQSFWKRSLWAFGVGIAVYITVHFVAALPKWIEEMLFASPFIATAIDLLFYSGLE